MKKFILSVIVMAILVGIAIKAKILEVHIPWVSNVATFENVLKQVRGYDMSWITLIHILFALAILFAVVTVLYILGTKAIFFYGRKEGFVSILVKGVENGAFNKALGAMKGYNIDPKTTEITVDPNAESKGFMGLSWIGLWPLNSAMVFDTEQTKIINKDDGSIGFETQKYPKTIYIPIQSTERLIVKGLELMDFASKIDFDVVITYMMTNVYTAKIKNRGSNKILKSKVEEGLREEAGNMSYPEAIKRKNATGEASFRKLVNQLNAQDNGFDSLSKETGYELISINVIGVELSGGNADKMAAAYGSILIAEKAKETMIIGADAEEYRLTHEGMGNAKAAEYMLMQTAKRIELQKGLTDAQSMALAIENGLKESNAAVINIGGGQGAAPILDLSGYISKKESRVSTKKETKEAEGQDKKEKIDPKAKGKKGETPK
jgi:hypothetical protein